MEEVERAADDTSEMAFSHYDVYGNFANAPVVYYLPGGTLAPMVDSISDRQGLRPHVSEPTGCRWSNF